MCIRYLAWLCVQARHVAMVIGQAFSVAYKEFLRANGISEDALEEAEYAHVLNAQSAPQAELDLLRDRNKIRKVGSYLCAHAHITIHELYKNYDCLVSI